MGRILKARTMCSLFVVALAVVVLAPSAGAQSFHWGVKGGVTSSSSSDFCSQYAQWLANPDVFDVSGATCSSSSGKTSPLFGGFVEIPVTKRIGVQADVSWARRGLTTHLAAQGDTYDGTATIDYVDIGAMGTVTVHSDARKRFYVMAGPIFGVRVGQKGEISLDGVPITVAFLTGMSPEITAADAEAAVSALTGIFVPLGNADLLRRTTVSLGFGAGMNIGRFLVEFKFSQGLTSALRDKQAFVDLMNRTVFADDPFLPGDIASDPALSSLDSVYDKAKMRSISVVAGIRF